MVPLRGVASSSFDTYAFRKLCHFFVDQFLDVAIQKHNCNNQVKSQVILVNRLRFQSLWKVNCLGLLVGYTPIAILVGIIAASTDANILSINGEYVNGLAAIPASLLMSLIFSFVVGSLYSIIQWFGFTIYSRFNNLQLRYYETEAGSE